MSQKRIWGILSLVILIAAIALAVYWKQNQLIREKRSEINEEQKLIESLSKSLDESSISGIDIPTTNPLGEVTSETNPLENTNPFDEQYENPFQ
ncbi:MAG: hypothetical protein AAB407_00815 [Patescibacteria group bacterium]